MFFATKYVVSQLRAACSHAVAKEVNRHKIAPKKEELFLPLVET